MVVNRMLQSAGHSQMVWRAAREQRHIFRRCLKLFSAILTMYESCIVERWLSQAPYRLFHSSCRYPVGVVFGETVAHVESILMMQT